MDSYDARNARSSATLRSVTGFLDAVEREIDALDPAELIEFLEADDLPIDPRPAFESGLRAHLLTRFRSRFSH